MKTFLWRYLKGKNAYVIAALLGVGIIVLNISWVMAEPKAPAQAPSLQEASDLQIFEINTRAYFKEQGLKSFDDLTDAQIQRIKDFGFNALWMMGVWAETPKALEVSKGFEDPQHPGRVASAYAIPGYLVNEGLGGEAALKQFVKRAKNHGLRIFLDLIPNHHAMDSPLLDQCPDCFIYKTEPPPPEQAHLYFEHTLPDGRKAWFAYARFGYTTYTDNAQFNYFKEEAWKYLSASLQRIADLTEGGGVRIDLVSTIHPDAFRIAWYPELSREEVEKKWDAMSEKLFGRKPKQSGQLFEVILTNVKKQYPDFKAIGELYDFYYEDYQEWQVLGIDLTYSKYLYNMLVFGDRDAWPGFKNYILRKRPYQKIDPQHFFHSLYFLENHDETTRLLEFLRRRLQKPAVDDEVIQWSKLLTTAIATIPGVPLIYMGQMEGYTQQAPSAVWIGGNKEPDNAELLAFYHKLFNKTKDPVFRRGELKQIPLVKNQDLSYVFAFARIYQGRYGVVVMNHSREELNLTLDLPKIGLGEKFLKVHLWPWDTYVEIFEHKE